MRGVLSRRENTKIIFVLGAPSRTTLGNLRRSQTPSRLVRGFPIFLNALGVSILAPSANTKLKMAVNIND